MSDDIIPALTPAEWAKRSALVSVDANAVVDPDGALEIYTGLEMVRVEPRRRHALGALALHGQAAGFTRQDVADVEEMEMLLLTRVRLDAEGQAQADRYASLAARIAALLPPEGP